MYSEKLCDMFIYFKTGFQIMIILMLAIIYFGLSSTCLVECVEVSKSSQATNSEEAAVPESPVSVGSVPRVRRKHWQIYRSGLFDCCQMAERIKTWLNLLASLLEDFISFLLKKMASRN